ncbi:MAG: signal peptide peptidase SppA [Deltaproteobacteria bacterium]|nr:signal peptide peptidase SppA [Deltaproteobacteria bacterium]
MRKFRMLIIVAAVGLVLLWLLAGGEGPSIEDGSILVIQIEGRYSESQDPSLLARVLTDAGMSFAALLSEMKKAERDDRISTVVLRIRNLAIGWGQAQELRGAIRRLEEAGRHPVAYLEVAGFGANLEYYVASAASEVQISPAGFGGVVGLAGEYFFLGQMWKKFGIEFDVARAGRYKSAVETLTGDEMSDAYRETANSLLDSINHQFISGIAESRKLTPSAVRAIIDIAPMTPRDMVENGLADEITFFDELLESLEGPIVEAADYAQIDPASLGFDPVAQFALVYGSGNVVVGDGRATSRGNPVMASDTVADALEAAADDPEIDAIIFRIDSPGGSVLAADIIWRAVEVAKRSGKPLIASFSNVAASGGYYVAAGADAILAPPASVTGSIGVFALRPVLKGLLDKLDINVETMTRGAHAGIQISSEPLSPETAAVLDREVEAIYRLFIERVAAGRELDLQQVDGVAQGRVWTGEQAFERGLIDELGGLSQAVSRAKQALGLHADADVALVPYPEAGSLFDQLTDTLRRVSLEAVPTSSLKGLAERMQTWFEAAPVEAPALVPPFAFDIR